MKRAPWIRQAIRVGNEHHYVKKTPWKHNLINLSALGASLAAIGGVFALGAVTPWWLYLPLAPLALGTLFFGLFVLVIHECSHAMFILHPDRAKAKKLNRWFGIATATPLFTDYLTHWEVAHPYHHLHPCEEDDIHFNHIYTGRELWKILGLLLLVPGYAVTLNPSRRYGMDKRMAATLALWAVFTLASGLLISWQVPLAAFMGFNVLQFWNLQRKTQEHGAGLKDEPDPLFRSRTWFSPLGFVGAPFCINYHFEHHLNFSVPWYDLPAYHRQLRQIVPQPLHPLVFTDDYFGQLADRRPRYTPDLLRLITGEEGDKQGQAAQLQGA